METKKEMDSNNINQGRSDNPTASGSHTNSRALGLVPGPSAISGPQNTTNITTRHDQQLNSPPAESVSRATQPLTTQAGLPRRRLKWTQDMNEFIIRAYYRITRTDSHRIGYRQQLYTAFIQQYPHLSHLTEQNVADRRAVIVRKQMLSQVQIDQIKAEVEAENNIIEEPDLGSQDRDILVQESHQLDAMVNEYINSNDDNNEPVAANVSEDQDGNTPRERSANSGEDENDQNPIPEDNAQDAQRGAGETNSSENNYMDSFETLSLEFNRALAQYGGMAPGNRPKLPRLKESKKLKHLIETCNNRLLPPLMCEIEDYDKLNLYMYCVAVSVTISYGGRITQHNRSKPQKNKMPKHIIRLQKKIEEIRKDLAVMTHFNRGTEGRRLHNKANRIRRKYTTHTQYDPQNRTNLEIIDTLRQKLQVYCMRLQRYKKSNKRREDNSKFAHNERMFYKSYQNNMQADSSIDMSEVERYWAGIWGVSGSHNNNASWLPKVEASACRITTMQTEKITEQVLQQTISRSQNWKRPGLDNISNYWIKKLRVLHPKMLDIYNQFIENPATVPQNIAEGVTYLIPKKSNTVDPSNFRPITCLNTMYKIFTGCISRIIGAHVEENNIIHEQQKGCRKGSYGCKEQLVIDSVILEQARLKNRNLYTCFIDYKKAFDSVSHSWLVKIMEVYKINQGIIECLKQVMLGWRTTLTLSINGTLKSTRMVNIKRGIYQGDSLSPLWFCLALNPISTLLIGYTEGYSIKYNNETLRLNHLLYMDDLKIYSGTKNGMENLVTSVEIFSRDINMQFGIDKCRTQNITRGKFSAGEALTTKSGELIPALEQQELYKYLGICEGIKINHTDIKNDVKNEYLRRVKAILKTGLNAKNLTKAINTWAIPVLSYTFGIIKWSETDAEALNTRTRTLLTKFRCHHPNASTIRLTLPRKLGGRGLIDINRMRKKQTNNLKQYFLKRAETSTLHKAVAHADLGYTPLNLSNITMNHEIEDASTAITKWKSMALHGKYPTQIDDSQLDKKYTMGWLTGGDIYPETEGFLVAIQDGVVPTKNYLKYIIKDNTINSDKCRLCMYDRETVDHILNGCTSIAQTKYKKRHDDVGKIIHSTIAYQNKFIQEKKPYYKYKPAAILENNNTLIYWDRSILTDQQILNNRPDMIVHYKREKKMLIIDFAVPLASKLQNTYSTKITKYREISNYLKTSLNLTSIRTIPIMISSTGDVPKSTVNNLREIGLPERIITQLQKSVILNSTRIMRETLNIEG